MKKTIGKRGRIIIWSVTAILVTALVVMPAATVSIYEGIFSCRYDDLGEFTVEDFEGLQVKEFSFDSQGAALCGYIYSRTAEPKAVVVFAHGLGSGGHRTYLPLIDALASGGYDVFAYDALANGKSEGSSVEGLPRGIIDLENAISRLKQTRDRELPILLFGHSWGGYAVGNVLKLHPDVEGAVLVSAFDSSRDMLLASARSYVGPLADLTLPYVCLYEQIKFGTEYATSTALEGMENSNADIMVIHSSDDTTVPPEFGYDRFYERFGSDDRFEFLLYEDRGHGYIFYSNANELYADSEAQLPKEADRQLVGLVLEFYDNALK